MLEVPTTYASGGNYRITIEQKVAVCRVIRRPDVTREVGAGYAREKIALFQRLAQEPREKISGVVLDLAEAPTSWGPMTHSALVAMVAAVHQVGRRIALVGADDYSQKLLIATVLAEAQIQHAKVFAATSEAIAWIIGAR